MDSTVLIWVRRISFRTFDRFKKLSNFLKYKKDWEFPGDRGGTPEDKPNFTKLVQEFRIEIENEKLEDEQDPLLMSAAVAAGKNRVNNGYEIKEISQELDFINLMT
jgi:chitinase